MLLISDRAPAIGRENNVIYVDFTRVPEPPAPRFPGATGLRVTIDYESSEFAGEPVDFKMAS